MTEPVLFEVARFARQKHFGPSDSCLSNTPRDLLTNFSFLTQGYCRVR